ncbi:MAG: MgtC/SapB family protein, partial [Betaproteobacteria bacterium]|nr:MgtC/SapB family protein [Betaproteobacteria bacterium]
MLADEQSWIRIAVALGIGLMIGAERERRKGMGAPRAPAGIRTFAAVSLLGAVSASVGDMLLLAISAAAVAAFSAIAYARTARQDPGLTTEIALLLTLLLGAMAMHEPAQAAGIAATVALLLAARE